MSTADQVEGYLGSSAKAAKSARVVPEWTGKHRVDARAMLTVRRLFYRSRHRRP